MHRTREPRLACQKIPDTSSRLHVTTPRCLTIAALAIAMVTGVAPTARAQGGGASQTASLNGRVTDAQGGALANVTVTATSPAQMGAQTTVTNDAGVYRFAALAPGRYTVQYELAGFAPLTRADVELALGFTATISVRLPLASRQESVTVVGDSPVIDTSATRAQVNFTGRDLSTIPSARDIWGLLAVTPGVMMGRFDIGGNRAGSQTSYRVFGYGGQDQQVRLLVEGINATDGRSANGFFQDYGSLDEVFIGTAAQGAEMPAPGALTQMVGRSGGNRFQGEAYADFEDNALQAANVSGDLIARGIAEHGNEIRRKLDRHLHAGGPVRRDALWYYAAYRQLTSAADQLNFRFDQTFDTTLYNASAKATYRLASANRFIGYYQWGRKKQPYRQWNGTYNYFSAADTTRQDDGSWVWKGEWNGSVSGTVFVESRYGVFGYYLPLLGNSDDPFRQDTGTRVSSGGDRRTQTDRDRRQWTTAAAYYRDGGPHGSHTVRFGGEMNLETAWTGFERTRAGNVEQIFNNGRATQVILGFPTADGELGRKSSRDRLLSIAKLDQWSGFLADQWAFSDRLTFNAGLRFDRYHSYVPEQRQLAYTNGPVTLPAQTFPRQGFFTWTSVVPRAGVAFSLDGKGTTVAKVNYGFFRHNPSFDIATAANPNQGAKSITYTWTDRNGDRTYQPGEEGTVVSSNLAGAVAFDAGVEQPYTHEFSAFLERRLSADMGLRAGAIYKTNDALWQPYRPFRPIDAYTTPFVTRDAGADGLTGTADDRDLTFYGTPTAALGAATTVIQTVPAFGRYTSLQALVDRRLRGRWTFGAGVAWSWIHEHNNNYIGNNVSPSSNPGYPNSPNEMLYANGRDGAFRFTLWDVKAHVTWEAPLGISVTPVLRLQAGQPFGRVLQVAAPSACACFFSGPVLVEPIDARRMDTVRVFDLRLERSVPLGRRARARLFVDVFNVFNSSAADVISFTTGQAFELPASVIAPRLARVGVQATW